MRLKYRLLIIALIMSWALGNYHRSLQRPLPAAPDCKPQIVYVQTPMAGQGTVLFAQTDSSLAMPVTSSKLAAAATTTATVMPKEQQ